jgi:hypothetical protein
MKQESKDRHLDDPGEAKREKHTNFSTGEESHSKKDERHHESGGQKNSKVNAQKNKPTRRRHDIL